MLPTRKIFSSIAAIGTGVALSLASLTANAADYPDRTVTFVVGYAAGGATDILARLISKSMSEELGQPIIVENKAGANSNIGADYVARVKKTTATRCMWARSPTRSTVHSTKIFVTIS